MSMSDRDGFIWQDGKLVPWREATTHVLTHSLHYGMGVFEGVRAYKTERGTAIFRLKEHTERLFRSAHIFQMQMPSPPRNSTKRRRKSSAPTISNPATCVRSPSTARKRWAFRPRAPRCT
jgi:branched-subunit amino acid aminotransferase/4-amino-4-deoxychorismate lyase